MALPYQLIDAFTSAPFAGNPAAVVHFAADDPRAQDAELLLAIAREYNLSETAFLVPLALAPEDDGTPRYSLRWFTPTQEFPLCGHATLASSHALFTTKHADAQRLRFETMSGTLHAARLDDGRIELDFPADKEVLQPYAEEEEKTLRDMIVLANADLAKAVRGFALGRLGVVVELDEQFDLRNAKIDAKPLAASSRYFIFTQPAHAHFPEFAIYSRVFDGAEDCPEDPVTGSAHCMLAPYYLSPSSPGHASIASSPHKTETSFLAKQGGPRQGELEVVRDEEAGRVKLRGGAVTVMEGSLRA
ncbi:hypothetical protein JCM10450v2_001031 [Rhodotorula kratochvilovae]